MGFWTSYVGDRLRRRCCGPTRARRPAMLLLAPVVLAGLLVPGAVARVVPVDAALALRAVLPAADAGRPGDHGRRLARRDAAAPGGDRRLLPRRHRCSSCARPTRRARWSALGPGRARRRRGRPRRWRRLPAGAGRRAGGRVGLAVLAAWPLVTGRAVERQLDFDLPACVARAGRRPRPRGPTARRAMVLPGQLFASSTRGAGRSTRCCRRSPTHPVTTRWIVPFADLRSTELQFAVDGLVTQERLRPGQLAPLLDLLGRRRRGRRRRRRPRPQRRDAGRRPRRGCCAGAPGRRKAYGPGVRARSRRPDGRRRPRVPAAAARRGADRRPRARAAARRAAETVVDGAAGALAGLAGYGALRPGQALAGTRPTSAPPALRRRRGRRRVVRDRPTPTAAARSWRRAPEGRGRPDAAARPGRERRRDDPRPVRRPRPAARRRTGASCAACASVTAPASPQVTQFPDQRPFAAVDGDPSTAWIADRALVPVAPHADRRLRAPRATSRRCDLLPYSDSRGRRAGGRRQRPPVRRAARAGTRCASGCAACGGSKCTSRSVTKPRDAHAGAGGIRELAIPGMRATRGAAAADRRRGRAAGDRPVAQRVDLHLRSHDGRRAGGPAALRRGAGRRRAARRAGPRARAAARDPPAGGAHATPSTAGAIGRPAHARPRARRTRGRAATAATVEPVGHREPRCAAPTPRARFEGLGRYRAVGRVRRPRRPRLDRAVDARPAGVDRRGRRPGRRRCARCCSARPRVRVRRPTRVRADRRRPARPVRWRVGAGGARRAAARGDRPALPPRRPRGRLRAPARRRATAPPPRGRHRRGRGAGRAAAAPPRARHGRAAVRDGGAAGRPARRSRCARPRRPRGARRRAPAARCAAAARRSRWPPGRDATLAGAAAPAAPRRRAPALAPRPHARRRPWPAAGASSTPAREDQPAAATGVRVTATGRRGSSSASSYDKALAGALRRPRPRRAAPDAGLRQRLADRRRLPRVTFAYAPQRRPTRRRSISAARVHRAAGPAGDRRAAPPSAGAGRRRRPRRCRRAAGAAPAGRCRRAVAVARARGGGRRPGLRPARRRGRRRRCWCSCCGAGCPTAALARVAALLLVVAVPAVYVGVGLAHGDAARARGQRHQVRRWTGSPAHWVAVAAFVPAGADRPVAHAGRRARRPPGGRANVSLTARVSATRRRPAPRARARPHALAPVARGARRPGAVLPPAGGRRRRGPRRAATARWPARRSSTSAAGPATTPTPSATAVRPSSRSTTPPTSSSSAARRPRATCSATRATCRWPTAAPTACSAPTCSSTRRRPSRSSPRSSASCGPAAGPTSRGRTGTRRGAATSMAPYHYLGPRSGPKLYEKRHGKPEKHAYGETLWACHIGPTLRLVAGRPSLVDRPMSSRATGRGPGR